MSNWFIVFTFGDIIGLIFLSLFLLVAGCLYGFMFLQRWWEQMCCKHDGTIRENAACDAICCKCGKNLGFIGTWREKCRQ